jgi:phosphonopyruvate decarboxylase
MIRTRPWAVTLADRGYRFAAGVPCSSLDPLQESFRSASEFTYIAAPNEGQAIAVASGAVMAGQKAVVLMQNSGLGNAINPLTSLVETFELPLVLITSWRGQPGTQDEPQHFRMGRSTHAILSAIEIPHFTLEADDAEAQRQLRAAIDVAEEQRRCVAIVVPDGVFERLDGTPEAVVTPASGEYRDLTEHQGLPTRTEILAWLHQHIGPDAVLLATTGKTGRELYAISDDSSHLYVVGSMGLASSVGLGLSLSTSRQTVVIDGDGAALMHLGALPMIARYGGHNLLHLVLDNGCYDSTGGQPSIASHAPFAEIAARCGYAVAARVDSIAGLAKAIATKPKGPALVHGLMRAGSPPALPRPSLAPAEVLKRMQSHFGFRK